MQSVLMPLLPVRRIIPLPIRLRYLKHPQSQTILYHSLKALLIYLKCKIFPEPSPVPPSPPPRALCPYHKAYFEPSKSDKQLLSRITMAMP